MHQKSEKHGRWLVMRFSLNLPVKVIMLGSGGTGGHIAPNLYRLLFSLNRPIRIIIADGDLVESKNLIRQNFIPSDLGKNKAQVLAERYGTAFGLEIEYIPSFIEEEDTLLNLIQPDQRRLSTSSGYPYELQEGLVILIGAVDNNQSRKLCHAVFKKAQNLIYIDSGNGEFTGQVVCGIKRKGKTYYKPVCDIYPDILEDNDKFPTQLSCAEASVSAPQSIVANIMAATVVIAYLYNILVLGSMDVRSVTFSTKTMNVKSILGKTTRKSAMITRRKAA